MKLLHVILFGLSAVAGVLSQRNLGNPFVSRPVFISSHSFHTRYPTTTIIRAVRQSSGSRRNRPTTTTTEAPDYDDNPQYSYSYAVNEPETKDVKMAEETRNGDFTKGMYSLMEPDGSTRTVEYVVHGDAGFNAVVRSGGETTFHGPLAKELFGGAGAGGSGGNSNRPSSQSGRPNKPPRKPSKPIKPTAARPTRPLSLYGVPLAGVVEKLELETDDGRSYRRK